MTFTVSKFVVMRPFHSLIKWTLMIQMVVFLGHSYTATAQISSSYQPYDLIPQSPETASLGKYVDQQVSKYTGLPEISILFHKIKYGNITVPVSLDYHAGGVRVDDVASRVGLNWSLGAEGMVSRNVRGRGDFYVPGGQTNRTCYYDEIPDEYIYSFAGYTGRFSFVTKVSEATGVLTMTPTLEDANNLKIKYEYTLAPGSQTTFTVNKFTITTDEGLVYTFDTREITMGAALACGSQWEGSSETWYLTQIFDPLTNKTVYFEYETISNFMLDSRFMKKYYAPVGPYTTCGDCQTNPNFYNQCSTQGFVSAPKVLKKITFGDGSVEFTADISRQDMPGDFAYSKIALKYKTSVIKAFQLNMSHVGGSTAKSKRLVLQSIKELGNGLSDGGKPPYVFTYDNISLLPERGSFQQDAFGFYNGNGATTSEPKIWVYTSLGKDALSPIQLPSTTELGSTLTGFSKQPNQTLMMYGHLKKITYPTGGTVDFTMEPNQFIYYNNTVVGGGIRIKNKSITACSTCDPIVTSYSYIDPATSLSSGAINNLPKFAYICNRNYTLNTIDGFRNAMLRSSENAESTRRTQGSIVGYSVVTETFAEGKIVDYYDNPALIPDEAPAYTFEFSECMTGTAPSSFRPYDRYPFYPYTNNDLLRGQMTRRMIYNAAGTKVRDEETEFDIQSPIIKTFNCGTHQMHVRYSTDGEPCPVIGRAKILTTMTYKTQYKVPIRFTNTDLHADGSTSSEESWINYLYANNILYKDNYSSTTSYGYDYEKYDYLFQVSNTEGQYALTNNFVRLNTRIDKSNNKMNNGLLPSGRINFNYTLATRLQLNSLEETNTGRFTNYLSYDNSGNPTSAIDEKGIKYSYEYGYLPELIVAVAKNAELTQFAATSFEYVPTPVVGRINIQCASNGITTTLGGAKSGKYYYIVPTGSLSISGLNSSKSYRLSFAAKRNTADATLTVAGNTFTINSANYTNWKNEEIVVTGSSTVTFGGTGSYAIDDVRIVEVGVELTTYTYEPLIGVTSVVDPNGITTSYEYDQMSRLKLIRDNNKNILKKYTYNYIKNSIVEQ